MEPEIDQLRRNLERYRLLIRNATDDRLRAILSELIAEATARLKAIESGVDIVELPSD